MSARIAGVFDVGRSSAKFAAVDIANRTELESRKVSIEARSEGPYPHVDHEALWEFLLASAAELNALHPLDALCITTIGATAALVTETGELALPILDRDYPGPASLESEYDRLRPDFAETLSPRLPAGLNLGAQLYWQARTFPTAFDECRWILPFPQYWGFRLTGEVASEVTSLGCHTDLWALETDLYSSLVLKQGWLPKMPEVRRATDVLGIVDPRLCEQLGLRPRLPVHVGIQNENAALLPRTLDHQSPFALVMSGDSVTVMAPGGDLTDLDPARGCLALVDAQGRPVPSARFPGGREYRMLVDDSEPHHISEAAIARVLDDAIMLFPSVIQGVGPFPERRSHWNRPAQLIDSEARFVAISFYLALVTAECLDLVGADGPTIVEGAFAANRHYLDMLVAATSRPVEPLAHVTRGSTVGAALLARMEGTDVGGPLRTPTSGNAPLVEYAARWRAAVAG